MGIIKTLKMRIFNLLTIGSAVNAQYNDASTGSELTDAIFKSLMFCHEWINNAMTCDPPKSKIPNYEFRFAKVMKDAAWHVLAIKNCNFPRAEDRYRRSVRDSFSEFPIDEAFSMGFEADYQSFIVAYLSNPAPFEFHPKMALPEDDLGSAEGPLLRGRNGFLESDPGSPDGPGSRGNSEKRKLALQAKRCKGEMTKLWGRDELNQCPKLGSWQRRINGLIRTVSIMQTVCTTKKPSY